MDIGLSPICVFNGGVGSFCDTLANQPSRDGADGRSYGGTHGTCGPCRWPLQWQSRRLRQRHLLRRHRLRFPLDGIRVLW